VRRFNALIVLGLALSCAGCGSQLLPDAGPNALAVKSGGTWTGPQYGLVKLTPQVVNILDQYGPPTLSAVFGDHRPPPEIKLGIGDVVSVSIFEAAAGGLFIPAQAAARAGNFVTIPNEQVDSRGFISIPYAGLVPTAGKTVHQVEQEIVARIKNRAIDPQVVVTLVTQNSSLITVIGEVNTATAFSPTGRIPALLSGERLLDVITRAGGLRDQGQDLWVVLERNGHRASVPFGALIYEPGNNIWAWPGDTIYLYMEPQTFLAFGASGTQGQFKFSAGTSSSAWRMTLAEAIAAAGGLLDVQADPGSVFLYRREPRQLAERLGVDCSKMDGPTVPIVYSVSFSNPAGYFLATRMQMRNKDLIFAANAQSVDITKFTNFVDALLTVPSGVTALGTDIETWRILSQTTPSVVAPAVVTGTP
jgi:polysaccharide biosynthesis/export protein